MSPLERCQKDGRPGWKWGAGGACFTYDPNDKGGEKAARKKAMDQAVAIAYSEKRAGKTPEFPVK